MTWNRLLLLAYPKGPRRAEVLDTLTEAAEAGGRRPRATNLIRYGLRARLGHPRSRTVVVLSLLLALAGGFLAGSATNRLAWQAAGPGLPGPDRAQAVADLVTPGLRLELYGGDAFGDGPFGYPPGEEVAARLLHDRMPGTPETRDVAAFMTALRHRLEAAGWQVDGPVDLGADGESGARQGLGARRDGLILDLGDNYVPAAGDDFLIVSLHAAEPAWISAVTVAGGLLGAAVAWLLAGWAGRRADGAPAASGAAGAAAWLGLLLLWPSLHQARGYLPALAGGDYTPSYPFWAGLTPTSEHWPLAVLAGLLFTAALGIALPGRRTAAPGPAPAAG